MDLLLFLRYYWEIILFIGGVIYWFARLEAKVQANSSRIAHLESKDDSIEELKTLVVSMDAKLTVLIPNYTGK